MGNLDKAIVERWFFLFCSILWGSLGIWLCTLGFGSDPDAWLMAQTAEKMRLGLGYDPARSAGNPLYEFLLVLLQPRQTWIFSNLANLLVAGLILKRLPLYFNDFKDEHGHWRLLVLMLLPVFQTAATCSMETVLGLGLWLETGVLIRKNRAWLAALVAAMAMATRPEYFLLLSVQYSHFWKNARLQWLLLLFMAMGYLAWAAGKNPMPFSDPETALRFYGGRVLSLFQNGESILYLLLLLSSVSNLLGNGEGGIKKAFLFSLILFVLFPFEWAYLLPALVLAVMYIKPSWRKAILIASFILPFASWKNGPVGFATPWADREWKLEIYLLAQRVDFQKKTLLLYGATWLPTDVKTWEKSMQNRLFHRRNSNVYVGEKLRFQLDSLHLSGFDIVVWRGEPGEFRMATGKLEIPGYVIVVSDLVGFFSQHPKSKF